tara:strand:+ start:305 stop:499 length:195 start_codon:yes stop_codon:yes gene_type:complete
MQEWQEQILEREQFNKRDMNTENIYQIIDDLEGFADKIGSEWMKERVAMLEAQLAALEINQSTK